MKLKSLLSALVISALICSTATVSVHAEDAATEEETEAKKQAAYDLAPDSDAWPGWPAGPHVYADSAIVMEMDTGTVLYAKKPEERHFPASITKLLTALVALENSPLTDTVTFSEDCINFLNWDDANIGMMPGEQISMNDALHAVLLASANEVSYGVAKHVGEKMGGNYDTFIQAMNDRAKELGCTGSHWVNANGLHDEEHYTTARDMALIASAVYQLDDFRKIEGDLEYTINPTPLTPEPRTLYQNHKMLWPENYYYCSYCKAGKTGYTDQSGTTLVTMADNGSYRLAAVVLHDYGTSAYDDTRAMLDYVYNNFSKDAGQNAFVCLGTGQAVKEIAADTTETADDRDAAASPSQKQDTEKINSTSSGSEDSASGSNLQKQKETLLLTVSLEILVPSVLILAAILLLLFIFRKRIKK